MFHLRIQNVYIINSLIGPILRMIEYIVSFFRMSKYVTRQDILCPNAVKRDVGKTRCKNDVIYATALCCAICTSLNVICNAVKSWNLGFWTSGAIFWTLEDAPRWADVACPMAWTLWVPKTTKLYFRLLFRVYSFKVK